MPNADHVFYLSLSDRSARQELPSTVVICHVVIRNRLQDWNIGLKLLEILRQVIESPSAIPGKGLQVVELFTVFRDDTIVTPSDDS